MSTELVERLRAHVAELEERLERESGDLRYAKQALDLETARALKFGKRITALTAEVALLTEALEWYGERARLARLIHSGGDPARFELSDDGGKRARRALSEPDKNET